MIKSDIKSLSIFLAATIWADGVYDEAEKDTIDAIAEAFGFGVEQLHNEIDSLIASLDEKSEEEINEMLLTAGAEIKDEEADLVYEAALELTMIDGVLSVDEVSNLISIADALGIDTDLAMLMMANYVKDTPEV
ncbi:hypothetical protein, partial [Porphyromonas levii]|uniref:hypothetical protein n=1 Tax=Porphyromonas levii TaxID=28114 RepID=UPI001B8AEF90